MSELGFVLHGNDSAREAKPSVWIYSGPMVGWLVVGVAFFVVLSMILSRLGLEWWIVILISAIPLLVITLFVKFLVNGRPSSFAIDLMTFQVFRLKTFLFLNGLLNRPPQIWRKGMKPAHPNDFK